VGTRTRGRDRAVVLGDCQKITSRPPGGGEDELGPVLAGSFQHQIDGHAPPATGPHRHLLQDLGHLRPVGGTAVQLGGAGPAVGGLSTTSPSGNGSRTRKPSRDPSSGCGPPRRWGRRRAQAWRRTRRRRYTGRPGRARRGSPDTAPPPDALAELATLERAERVVEDRYPELFKLDHVTPGFVPELLARVQVRYPCVTIIFCDSRALAEEWTFRLLGAALAHLQAEHHNNDKDRQ
jgi:hypothetical protein